MDVDGSLNFAWSIETEHKPTFKVTLEDSFLLAQSTGESSDAKGERVS
jgi:hypothetical protein